MKKALIYLRVSTPGQAKKENPIEAQREACLEYARSKGYSVNPETDIYIDGGISGRTDDRDAFRAMNARLNEDDTIDVVIAYDISRIFRNGVEYFKYKKQLQGLGKRFLSVSENLNNDGSPSDFLVEWMLAGVHEFRSRQDGEKIRLGMLNKAKGGKYPGFAPFGYKNMREFTDGGKDKRWMTTNEIEAPWVKRAFELYATAQHSLRELADMLKAEGFPDRSYRCLSAHGLEKMLKNKLYIAWVVWGGVELPNGKHERLVEDDLFYKVQSIFEARNYHANRKRKHTFLLRGLAFCEECGSRWTAGYHHGKKNKDIIYGHYSCQKRIGTKPVICSQPTVTIDELEGQFSDIFKMVQITDSFADKIRAKIKEIMGKEREAHDSIRKSISANLDGAEIRRRRLLDKYVEGLIDDASYTSYKSDLDTRISQLKEDIGKIDSSLAVITKVIEEAVMLASNCHRAYQKATYEQKSILAQAFFNKIMIKDKKIVSASLNEPLSFICKQRAQKSSLFQLQYSGGDGGSRIHVWKLDQIDTTRVVGCC